MWLPVVDVFEMVDVLVTAQCVGAQKRILSRPMRHTANWSAVNAPPLDNNFTTTARERRSAEPAHPSCEDEWIPPPTVRSQTR